MPLGADAPLVDDDTYDDRRRLMLDVSDPLLDSPPLGEKAIRASEREYCASWLEGNRDLIASFTTPEKMIDLICFLLRLDHETPTA